ncbi:MAG: hypothetical protein J6Y78_08465 [Paludibacteraceae bacterium]|nr:hypothetical protein [Paludibacteraceae bacterium]
MCPLADRVAPERHNALVTSANLINKASKIRKAGIYMAHPSLIDLTGQRFGKLVVLEQDKSINDNKHSRWICKCDCGNTKSVISYSLRKGITKSCGCIGPHGKKGVNKTHGMSKTRIYHEWLSMRGRCLPNSPNSYNYYQRGITVCEEWLNDFMPFYDWAIANGYDDSLTLDRINNDSGYSPDNCRWVKNDVQQRNKTNNIKIMYEGEEYCLKTIAEKLGFSYKTIYQRYTKLKKNNQSIDTNILFAPVDKSKGCRFRK